MVDKNDVKYDSNGSNMISAVEVDIPKVGAGHGLGLDTYRNDRSNVKDRESNCKSTCKNEMVTSKCIAENRKAKDNIVANLKFVIFPHDRWIRYWDVTMLVLLVYIAFAIPYQVGVSGGYYLLINVPWLVINVLINSIFFIDTWLFFFRAYYENGRLVINPCKIRRHYLRTLFIPNLLSCLPTTLLFYLSMTAMIEDSIIDESSMNSVVVIKFLDILKFARFARLKTVMLHSSVMTEIRQNQNSQKLQLFKFTLMIVVCAHWFACLFCFVAFLEANGFGQNLLISDNWISYYVNSTTTGINPIGWTNDIPRYVLSLFWAIQTITSIGYGNIMPFTTTEWFITSILMLLSGILWAYIIGGLVCVASALSADGEVDRARIDDANKMISFFETPEEYDNVHESEAAVDSKRNRHKSLKFALTHNATRHNYKDKKSQVQADDDDTLDFPTKVKTARRIKTFLHNQTLRSNNKEWRSAISSSFPVFDSLPPELQFDAALLLCKSLLDQVPYLSDKFLNAKIQARVAKQCKVLEFSAGEHVNLHFGEDLGGERGAFVFRIGLALGFHCRTLAQGTICDQIASPQQPVAYRNVLLEDDHPAIYTSLRFLTYSQVLYIPRDAIMAALHMCPKAWKDCARYNYAYAVLRHRAIMNHRAGQSVGDLPADADADA